jgi:hypothetical protein
MKFFKQSGGTWSVLGLVELSGGAMVLCELRIQAAS